MDSITNNDEHIIRGELFGHPELTFKFNWVYRDETLRIYFIKELTYGLIKNRMLKVDVGQRLEQQVNKYSQSVNETIEEIIKDIGGLMNI